MQPGALATVPAEVQPFLTITEIDDAEFFAGPLFRRKFGVPPPTSGHHLGAFYRDAGGCVRLAGYSHMWPFGDVYLSGGSCSDGAVIGAMQDAERTALYAAGGVWHLVLKYAFRRYADRCDAFFGHCGDARAREVALRSGFEDAGHPHLIVNWHKPLHPNLQRALIAKVHALGPF